MGDMADAMLDGTLCEGCGAYIDGGEAEGFPRHCGPECAGNRGADWWSAGGTTHSTGRPKIKCPICKRRVKFNGLRDHTRAVHGHKPEDAP